MEVEITLAWLPDYSVSSLGVVRRITPAVTRKLPPYIIKGGDNGKGYQRVKLMLPDGSKKSFMVHSLVCEAFHGPRPEGTHAAHWDGDSKNNNFLNLRWATPQQNVGNDRRRHGRTPRGERNGRAILTAKRVEEIRAEFTGKFGQITQLAERYGLSHSGMRSVVKGENWR